MTPPSPTSGARTDGAGIVVDKAFASAWADELELLRRAVLDEDDDARFRAAMGRFGAWCLASADLLGQVARHRLDASSWISDAAARADAARLAREAGDLAFSDLRYGGAKMIAVSRGDLSATNEAMILVLGADRNSFLRSVIANAHRSSVHNFRIGSPTVYAANWRAAELGGIKVRLGGPDRPAALRGNIRRGFELFLSGARRRAPWLVERPAEIDVPLWPSPNPRSAARYFIPMARVVFYPIDARHDGPQRVAHVLAHEQGHHFWRTRMSGAAMASWASRAFDPKDPLDPRRIAAVWPDGARDFGEAAEWASRDLAEVAPVLSLQVKIAAVANPEKAAMSREEFESWAKQGEAFPVPRKPITTYARVNAEEAFCEAVGLVVAYGPRALDQEHLALLVSVAGRVRLNPRGRAAASGAVTGRRPCAPSRAPRP